jgi:hypothetical protein
MLLFRCMFLHSNRVYFPGLFDLMTVSTHRTNASRANFQTNMSFDFSSEVIEHISSGVHRLFDRDRSSTFRTDSCSKSLRSSRSRIFPVPSEILVRISNERWLPIRQGLHFPQLSTRKKFNSTRARSTTQVSSSQMSSAPEPSETPARLYESKSMGVSCKLAGMIDPLEPPVCAILKLDPSFIPLP